MSDNPLDRFAVADCELSVRTSNCLRRVFGDSATLGDVVRGGGVERMLTERHFGRRSANELRDMIRYVTGEAARIEERRRASHIAEALHVGDLRVVSEVEWAEFLDWKEQRRDPS